jgi:hypothetical protein
MKFDPLCRFLGERLLATKYPREKCPPKEYFGFYDQLANDLLAMVLIYILINRHFERNKRKPGAGGGIFMHTTSSASVTCDF